MELENHYFLLMGWLQLRQKAIALLMCVLAYVYANEIYPESWRSTPFPNFEKMMILYNVDRANIDEGEIVQEWRKRHHSSTKITETINNDMFVEDNSPGQGVSPEEDHLPHANGACSKKTKRTPRDHENSLTELTEAINAMVASLDRGNKALQRASNSKREVTQLSGEELCKMLEECGCDVDKIPDIYCFLMGDDKKLRTAVESPASIRKQVIMKMFYDSQ